MHFAVYVILILSVCVSILYGYSFNTDDVIFINEDSVKNTHFSYTLLLQSGEHVSSLIIGAPKNNNDPQEDGDIYKCDISLNGETSCLQYPAGRTISSNTTNGNFFGMSLDGEDHVNGALVACAPRTITSRGANFLKGYCIYMKNSSHITERPMEITPLKNSLYYSDSACCDSFRRPYYDFAFAMAGFDVSFYNEKKSEVLLGAPGVKKFNGATVSYSIDDHGISLLPTRDRPVLTDEDSYFGYAVSTGKFKQYSDMTWFIAGAPRSRNLRGKATIYYYDVMAREKMHIVANFEGDEVGSYFGASVLALDVTNDKIMDLFIGAPMAAGKTWDEGSVYFYKGLNEKSFLQKVKITGSSKKGSRFGSAIVSLGDFDLDGFNDIAISAPYEDDGRGAVYIYRGSSQGITDTYSQRLSSVDFNIGTTVVKGFGMGISRGNDIDGNGHNDIAIGAYKSDQTFIVKTYSIIDYQFRLTPSINTIINDTSFDMQFCLLYTKRSERHILPQVTFNVSIDLDYRSVEGKIVDNIDADLGKTMCKEYKVKIRPTMADISPFQISLKLDTEIRNIIAHGERTMEYRIPYSHGCGNDNICKTDLSLELMVTRNDLVLGLNKQINLTLIANNYGEPAYKSEVTFEVPDGIELRNNKDCTKDIRNYTCMIDIRLIGLKKKEFIFDVKDVKPDIPAIEIKAELSSLGINKDGNKARTNIILPVVLNCTPFIVGKSDPENMEIEMKTNMLDLEVIHQFSVGKTGPSPLELNIDLLLPVVEHNGESVFNILEVKGNIDTTQMLCTSTTSYDKTEINNLDTFKTPLNRTVVVSCGTEEKCLKYTCKGEYLFSSSQFAIFEIKVLTRSNLLVSKYKSELTTKDLIAFVPTIFQSGPTGRINASSMFLIFVHGVRVVPLWLYLVAPTIGIILLMLISFALYKCHFFDRVYKDKLDQEKILGEEASVEEEIFDDVVFRPMEEKTQTSPKDYL